MNPVIRTETTVPIESAAFSKSLGKVYESNDVLPDILFQGPLDLDPFKMDELTHVLKKMRNRKSADTANIVVEMIKNAGHAFHSVLLGMYNQILLDGCVPAKWHITVFRMLPKSGNLNEVSNWRPIAILPILYKIFSRLLYGRLLPILEASQSNDQFGFRANRRIDDVFGIIENIIGKTNEWNIPLWMISLDLKKAFDRIEFGPLFEALREQGVPDAYIELLSILYRNQKGTVDGKTFFDIQRGVKQGDVLSAMLFNAGIEIVSRRWKARLVSEGFLLDVETERLTNVRYADDVLSFGKQRKKSK
jgi:hypothetical protein